MPDRARARDPCLGRARLGSERLIRMSSHPSNRAKTYSRGAKTLGPRRGVFWLRILGGALALALILWQGEQLARWLPEVEGTVQRLGPWGPLALSGAILVSVPLLIPDSIFGLTAGVAFGPVWGTIYYFGATYSVNLLIYAASRRWLRAGVLRRVQKRPRLRAILRAASAQSLGLTFLIRVIPIHSAAVSYALGAGGVSFLPFAIGSLGLFPHMFLTVYLGYAAAHLTKLSGTPGSGWSLETIATGLGLIACLLLVLQAARIARSAIEEAAGPDGQDL